MPGIGLRLLLQKQDGTVLAAALARDPTGIGKQAIRISGAIFRETAELFQAERSTTNAPYGNQIA